MTIVAILATVGVAALLSARKDRAVEGAAQNIVDEINRTKNYALETKSVTTCTPKLWALSINSSSAPTDPNTLSRWYYCGAPQNKWYKKEDIKKEFNENISSVSGSSTGIVNSINLIYSTPFGKYFPIKNGLEAGLPASSINADEQNGFRPNPVSGGLPDDSNWSDATNSSDFTIVLDVNGVQKNIIVKKNSGVPEK